MQAKAITMLPTGAIKLHGADETSLSSGAVMPLLQTIERVVTRSEQELPPKQVSNHKANDGSSLHKSNIGRAGKGIVTLVGVLGTQKP